MKFYLAARYSRYPEMQEVAARIREMGHTVTSRWIRGDHEMRDGLSMEASNTERERFAKEDLHDLMQADCIVSFTEPPRVPSVARGGRHVEFGLAYAANKLCIVIGYRENVFHYLPGVRFEENFENFIKRLYWFNETRGR